MDCTGQYAVAILGNNDGAQYTNDYGQTWATSISSALSNTGSDASFQHLVGGDQNYVYISSTYGQSWTRITSTYGNLRWSGCVSDSVFAHLMCQANGNWYYSTDNFASYNKSDLSSFPTNDGILTMPTYSGDGLYALYGSYFGSGIAVSYNHGHTWFANISIPEKFATNLAQFSNLLVAESGKLLVLIGVNGGGISFSQDYGNTWTLPDSGSWSSSVADSSGRNVTVAQCCGGGIYRMQIFEVGNPTATPTPAPSNPTARPTPTPTALPSSQPSSQPSGVPTRQPNSQPSTAPTAQPACAPTAQPSRQPIGEPTNQPTSQPSRAPTRQPTGRPSAAPSSQPSMAPTTQPSSQPTSPTSQPSRYPSAQPSSMPSAQPTSEAAAAATGVLYAYIFAPVGSVLVVAVGVFVWFKKKKGDESKVLPVVDISKEELAMDSLPSVAKTAVVVTPPPTAGVTTTGSSATLSNSPMAKYEDVSLHSKVTDVFLTHDWGVDELGRDNHARVSQVNVKLKELGLTTWFDSERLSGRILHQMTEGIDNAACVVVFVTERYMHKINNGDGRDNCQFEFEYAFRQKGTKFIIPVVMEARMRNPMKWVGVFGAAVGGLLYIDNVDDNVETACQIIYDRVSRTTGIRLKA